MWCANNPGDRIAGGSCEGYKSFDKPFCSHERKIAENIATAIANYNSGDLKEINKILTAKKRELVKLTHAKKDYNDLADEIDKICEKKQRIFVAKTETKGYKKRIEELQDFINEADMELSEYD